VKRNNRPAFTNQKRGTACRAPTPSLEWRRRSVRRKRYDYSTAGWYFVTVTTTDRRPLLCDIVAGAIRATELGRIVEACWDEIPLHFPHVRLDHFILMPNHIHGIIQLIDACRGTARRARKDESFGNPIRGSLPTIIRSFKSAATKRANILAGVRGASMWQRSFHEHIIRSDSELTRIREYIRNNPSQWQLDREHLDTGDRRSAVGRLERS
jgi:putative transposase